MNSRLSGSADPPAYELNVPSEIYMRDKTGIWRRFGERPFPRRSAMNYSLELSDEVSSKQSRPSVRMQLQSLSGKDVEDDNKWDA